MERCPTCGAAVRPGAKFCTSCGSRIEEQRTGTPQDTQETTVVATPAAHSDGDITPEPNWKAASGGAVEDETGDHTTAPEPESTAETPNVADETDAAPAEAESEWAARWPEPKADEQDAGSPSERFRDALDSGEKESHPTWTWTAPSDSDESSWSTDTDKAAAVTEATTPEASASALAAPSPDGDPRQHASELLDQLRALVWQLGNDHPAGTDEQTTIQTISRVRGETSDFADLESVIDSARENPRDIDALRELGEKAGRLHELLESHKRLVRTLEDALRDQ